MTRDEAIDYLLDPIGKREKHDEAAAGSRRALEEQGYIQRCGHRTFVYRSGDSGSGNTVLCSICHWQSP